MRRNLTWVEPNRANLNLLHIASKGARFSSLAGVRWIDDYRFLANHNSGLRIALFDLRSDSNPILTVDSKHRTDDIAVKKLDSNLYEVVVSGCWDAAYSIFHLIDTSEPRIEFVETKKNKDRSFSHGISYNQLGQICLTYSTGKSPRIIIGNKTWVLPPPWGSRFVTFCNTDESYYSVCVSETPKLNSYEKVNTLILQLSPQSNKWIVRMTLPGVHSDSCQFFNGRLWLTDQNGDQVIAIDFSNQKKIHLKGQFFNFPHGLSISNKGILAVTNYGNSSISLLDIKNY